MFRIILIIFSLGSLVGCEQTDDLISSEITSTVTVVQANESRIEVEESPPTIAPFELEQDNARYLFDVSKHTSEELQTLLNRVEEIHENEPEKYQGMDLVLILHGPDINHFTKNNYLENKTLVDQAARLDAFGMIDLKVCETYMSMIDVDRSEVPPFIEPVPYAPKEIERLTDIGYINL